MLKKSQSIVMALVAMTLFSSQNVLGDETEVVKKEVEKVKSQVITAAERTIHSHALGLGLGQTFLTGNFSKKGDDKITMDLLYSYTASYSFDLLVNLHSSEHSYKNKAVHLKGLSFSIKARPYEFDAFSPYILGGLGFYQPQIEKDNVISDAKNTFGLNCGAGVDLRLNHRLIIGILAQYHMPFEIKQDDTENVRGSYFKLLMTTMFQF